MAEQTNSRQLLQRRKIRAGLIVRGLSIAGWCRAEGVDERNAHRALMGKWRGPKATSVVEKLRKAAGL